MNFVLLFLLNNVYYKLLNPFNLGCENKEIYSENYKITCRFQKWCFIVLEISEIGIFIGLIIWHTFKCCLTDSKCNPCS